MSTINFNLSADAIKQSFKYDPESGDVTWACRPARNVFPGHKAGRIEKDGYLYITMAGNRLLAHRVAWVLYYGSWPDGVIDHRDGIGSNNKISNLRQATLAGNCQNSKLRNDSKTGYKGVSWHAARSKYRARINVAGKSVFIGYFDSAEAAYEAYKIASRTYHGEFSAAPNVRFAPR